MIQGYDYDNDNVHYMNLVDSFIDVESNIVIDSEEVLQDYNEDFKVDDDDFIYNDFKVENYYENVVLIQNVYIEMV